MHHGALTKSLQMLFENRLGHQLYFPHGRQWYNEGYWLIARPYNDHPITINQYLVAPTLNKTVNFQEFLQNDFDVVIASYYDHIRVYYKLIKNYNLKAKLVAQMGNKWIVDWGIVDNLMSSTLPIKVPGGKNAVFYHQEFDLDIYKYKKGNFQSNKFASFVHCLSEREMYKQDWQDFQELEKLMSDYKFKCYGITCRDGIIKKQQAIADKMRECKFGIHFKSGGDGYGHVIHGWMAVGRPVIFRGSQYKDKLAGGLLLHNVTGFDIEEMTLREIADKIRDISEEDYQIMCHNVNAHFKLTVDFNQDAKDVKKFLGRLI